MKALNLIEAYRLNISQTEDYKRHLAIPDTKYFFHTYFDLLSKKFEYDMIEKYFEGWKKISDDYYCSESGLSYEIDSFGYHYTNTNNTWNQMPFPPETLHDFIRDCQRSGIELILKQDILRGE